VRVLIRRRRTSGWQASEVVSPERDLHCRKSRELRHYLRDTGALQQIYAHLLSLLGWDRLIVKAMLRPRVPVAANA